MKQIVLIFALFCVSFSLSAQFGVNFRHNWNEASNWILTAEDDRSSEEILGDGFSFGVDYWFRLKDYRVEFLPEFNYTNKLQTLNGDYDHSTNIYSFYFNTNIYLFDLKGDCDCPTFSKEGPTLEKGFFLQISPGVSYFSYRDALEGAVLAESNEVVFSIAGAVGFDIGLSDLLTITPMVGLRYFPNNTREGISDIDFLLNGQNRAESDETSIQQVFAGLRLGVRLNQ